MEERHLFYFFHICVFLIALRSHSGKSGCHLKWISEKTGKQYDPKFTMFVIFKILLLCIYLQNNISRYLQYKEIKKPGLSWNLTLKLTLMFCSEALWFVSSNDGTAVGVAVWAGWCLYFGSCAIPLRGRQFLTATWPGAPPSDSDMLQSLNFFQGFPGIKDCHPPDTWLRFWVHALSLTALFTGWFWQYRKEGEEWATL